MTIIINWIVSAVAIALTAYFLPGVVVTSIQAALVSAAVLGLINALIRPIIVFITLPINILTLGLFTFVINAAIILFVAHFVPGFSVTGWVTAIIFSIILSIVHAVLHLFTQRD